MTCQQLSEWYKDVNYNFKEEKPFILEVIFTFTYLGFLNSTRDT